MIKKRSLLVLCIVLILLIQPSCALKVIEKSKEYWTCYDYSTDYSRKHPEWGMVTMSHDQLFRGVSHMVNYQVCENGSLLIHDGLFDADFVYMTWEEQGYYHFWVDETPVRYYHFLRDNREIVLRNVTTCDIDSN